MHHVTLDRWSRLASPLHALDARVKILAALAIVVSLVLPQRPSPWLLATYLGMLTALAALARLPMLAWFWRAAWVLPFAAGVSALNFFGGDPARGAFVLAKSYLSACCLLWLLGTTSLHALLRGLESLGAPRFLLMVAQFLYRYLFVLSEQAQHMRQARHCRAGSGRRQPLFQAATGAVAVLFARSYDRAERIHQAMLARGFQGHFVLLTPPLLGARDYAFLAAVSAALAALQLALWNL